MSTTTVARLSIPDTYFDTAAMSLPPLHLPRHLVARIEHVGHIWDWERRGHPEGEALRANAIIAYLVTLGLDAFDAALAAAPETQEVPA